MTIPLFSPGVSRSPKKIFPKHFSKNLQPHQTMFKNNNSTPETLIRKAHMSFLRSKSHFFIFFFECVQRTPIILHKRAMKLIKTMLISEPCAFSVSCPLLSCFLNTHFEICAQLSSRKNCMISHLNYGTATCKQTVR